MNVLVTGASRGVGLAICQVLLKQNFTVYAVSRSYTDDLQILMEQYPDNLYYKTLLTDKK